MSAFSVYLAHYCVMSHHSADNVSLGKTSVSQQQGNENKNREARVMDKKKCVWILKLTTKDFLTFLIFCIIFVREMCIFARGRS